MPAAPPPSAAIVAIGRNEGERLKSCLGTLAGQASTIVYVDSGSSDGSAAYAAAQGCHVVELSPDRPFTAARARNAGYAAVLSLVPNVPYIQFLDGDCDLDPAWLGKGIAALEARPDVAIVCGRVHEIHPDASVYNRLCDLEWQTTPGEIRSSGGRFLIRRQAFVEAGGFRADVIAAEDDEFCIRVRAAGWKILSLDAEMARHDAAITRFSQWWGRARRTGHAYAQVADIHGRGPERYFVRDCRRVWFWAFWLPLAALMLAPFTYGLSLLALIALNALQFLRMFQRDQRQRGWSPRHAAIYAFFTVLTKFPALIGILSYHLRKRRGSQFTIIEYKGSSLAE